MFSDLFDLISQLGHSLVKLPWYMVRLAVGISSAVVDEDSVAISLLAIAAIVGLLTVGFWVLCPIFVVYASMRCLADVTNAHTEQINFLARCIRDHA